MKTLRAPLLAAALIVLLGATAVHAACPRTAIFVYESPTGGYTLWCGLIAEYQGMCLMDCARVENPTNPVWY